MKIDRETFGKFFSGTPGKEWDDYAARLRNAAAGEVDERGYSLADEYDGVLAEGGPLGVSVPPCPPRPHSCSRLNQGSSSETTTEGGCGPPDDYHGDEDASGLPASKSLSERAQQTGQSF